MTKKDYTKIASVLVKYQYQTLWSAKQYRRVIIEDFADMLIDDNPHFNRVRFYTICGYSE